MGNGLWRLVDGQGALAAKTDLAAGKGDPAFLRAKIVTARFYGEHILPRALALEAATTAGAGTLMAMADESF